VSHSNFACSSLCDIRVKQVAKGVISNSNALVDLLESIEHFVGRLKIYTQILLTPAMVEIVVKIMAELIGALALATEKLTKRRRCELFFIFQS
jgi:hypothetical protein